MKEYIMLCAILGSAVVAHATPIESGVALCPDAINTRQQAVDVPPDYTPSSYPGIYVLQEIAFSDSPDGNASMDPQEVKGETGSAITKVWYFPKKRDRAAIFVNCLFDNTTVTLVRELSQEIAKCVVSYNAEIRVGGFPKVTSSYCTNSYEVFG